MDVNSGKGGKDSPRKPAALFGKRLPNKIRDSPWMSHKQIYTHLCVCAYIWTKAGFCGK